MYQCRFSEIHFIWFNVFTCSIVAHYLLTVVQCESLPIPGQRIRYHNLQLPSMTSGQYPNQTWNDHKYSIPVSLDGLTLQGKTLYDETLILKSLGHFNRERIPERVVHAQGATYYGVFLVTNSNMAQYTKASVFRTSRSKRTRVAVRFSTQLGERGSPDTPLGEVRGMGVKFYTDQGNYDLLSINLPVFFINDPQLFPQLTHAQKRDPRSDFRNGNTLWDFYSLRPETLNGVTFVYSDYGLPDGYSHMAAFSVNAFGLVNQHRQRYYAKFVWLPVNGIKSLNRTEAIRLAGEDPDYARRRLFESIENHNYPSWSLNIQVIRAEQIDDTFAYNPFDSTKLWPLDRFPLIEVGVMTLTKNVNNAFAENEQLALNPANLVPGIEPSPDRLLRGRLFAYRDTQVYRLGANHLLIPVNRQPRKTLSERDGAYRTDENLDSLPNYYPNSHLLNRPDLYDIVTDSFLFQTEDIHLSQADSTEQQYQHARQTYLSFTDDQRDRLHENLAFALRSVTKRAILERVMAHLANISPQYAVGVRTYLF